MRAILARIPRACWACAAIGFATAAIWALLTPAFWVPDEPVHVGYAQYLAETGKLPNNPGSDPHFSDEEEAAYRGVGFVVIGRPSYDKGRARRTQRALESHLGRADPGAAGYAVNNPPLYYALEAVPYRVLSGRDFWDRLLAMRLLSALFAGITVALTFLLARELLPASPFAWTVAALVVAFQPVFGFISGGVNNDSLVWLFGAAVLLVMARALRRGLTPARGAAVGLLLMAGALTKPSIYGLAPGVALGLALCVRAAPPERRRTALAGLGAAAAVTVLPAAVWLIGSHLVYDRPFSTATAGFDATGPNISIKGQLGYLWQSFLPRLPFMDDQFKIGQPYILWDSYFTAVIGRFGWFEFGFPSWANWVGLGVVSTLLASAGAALARADTARRHWPELLTFVTMIAGVLLVAGIAGYRYRADSGLPFEQVRYLFVLLPLWGLLVAVAVRGVGRNWTRAVGGLLVVLAVGHSALAMLLVADRFYG